MPSGADAVPEPDALNLVQRLRSRGLRVTPQRAMILRAIEETPGHITAEEVYTAVHRVSPYVNLATVYRTLELLRELDLITVADMGTGATHYALHSHANHHHAVCRLCRHALEFPPELLAPFVEDLHTRYGFAVDVGHIVVFGTCRECAGQGEDAATTL
jgi:Fur family transcriptional regulator, ferric uptake regulator